MRLEHIIQTAFRITLEAGEELEIRQEDNHPFVVEHGAIDAPDAQCKARAEVVKIKEDY